ncbi:hypothetical protein Hanom_Chr07g00601061 [Helianthus anomalus]
MMSKGNHCALVAEMNVMAPKLPLTPTSATRLSKMGWALFQQKSCSINDSGGTTPFPAACTYRQSFVLFFLVSCFRSTRWKVDSWLWFLVVLR